VTPPKTVQGLQCSGIRLNLTVRKGPTVDSKLTEEARKVLTVVSHAHDVFGGDVAPVEPPAFTGDRTLEDNLGLGHF
jgi:hypothetical protein